MKISDSKSLGQRLNEVAMKTCYVQKDTSIGRGNAKGVSHDAVIRVCGPPLREHGVGIATFQEIRDDDKRWFVTRFWSIDDRVGDTFDIPIQIDCKPDAQSVGACLSYAKKYALMSVLMMETGYNDESHMSEARNGNGSQQASPPAQAPPPNPAQAVPAEKKIEFRNNAYSARTNAMDGRTPSDRRLADDVWILECIRTVLGEPKINSLGEMSAVSNALADGKIDWETGEAMGNPPAKPPPPQAQESSGAIF